MIGGYNSSHTYICSDCRYIAKNNQWHINANRSFVCPFCTKDLINMGYRWRAPKKNNDKAWHLIQSGDIWWDKKVIPEHNPHNRLTRRFLGQ